MDKLLTASGLKAILSKHKVKDNGLEKALAAYEKLGDDAYDDCLEQLAQLGKLATALKKAKEAAENKAVVEYLENLLDAADGEEKDVSKAKESAEKDDKKKKDKEEEEDEADKKGGEDEEEEGEYGDQLLNAFKKVKSMNGEPLSFLFCDARPFPAIMVARRISSKHRNQLTEVTGGSKKFLQVGSCHFEDGKYVLTTDQSVPGLARRVQQSLKNHTGKKFKIAHGGETAEDEDGEAPKSADSAAASPSDAIPPAPDADEKTPSPGVTEDPSGQPAQEPGAPGKPAAAGANPPENMTKPFSISGSVGRGGKNKAEDTQAVQAALNIKAKAGLKVDGLSGPKTIAAIMAFQKTLGMANPDGLVEPGRGTARGLSGHAKVGPPTTPPKPVAPPTLPKAELGKAPEIWHQTREILQTNIDELKKAVKAHYSSEHPSLLKGVELGLSKLDNIVHTLDTKLSDSLARAAAAAGEAARKAELQNSKTILTSYIKYVKSEPLIAHIDGNPFGVSTNLKKVLTDALTHMAQAMA